MAVSTLEGLEGDDGFAEPQPWANSPEGYEASRTVRCSGYEVRDIDRRSGRASSFESYQGIGRYLGRSPAELTLLQWGSVVKLRLGYQGARSPELPSPSG